MKTSLQFYYLNALALVAAVACLGIAASNSAAEEKSSPPVPAARVAESNAVPQSTFVLPANGSEGRDPFFPKSERPWRGKGPVVVAAHPTQTAVDLAYIVFSGTPEHRLATITINGIGRTLAVSETSEVATRGNRVEVRCIEITEEKVVLEVNGESRVIPFRSK